MISPICIELDTKRGRIIAVTVLSHYFITHYLNSEMTVGMVPPRTTIVFPQVRGALLHRLIKITTRLNIFDQVFGERKEYRMTFDEHASKRLVRMLKIPNLATEIIFVCVKTGQSVSFTGDEISVVTALIPSTENGKGEKAVCDWFLEQFSPKSAKACA